MFYECVPKLVTLARSEMLKIPTAPAESELPDRFFSYSQRCASPVSYRALQAERRDALIRLLAAPQTPDHLRTVADLAIMLCEESAWGTKPFTDDPRELSCIETAVLLSWTACLWSEIFLRDVPGLTHYLHDVVRTRIIHPIINPEHPFWKQPLDQPMTVLSGLVTCVLLIEEEPSRRQQLLKPLMRRLDNACQDCLSVLPPLSDLLREVSAVTDLVILLRLITNGAIDYTESVPTGYWLDSLLFPWIQGSTFMDPAGSSAKPVLPGIDLFRVGSVAQDRSVMELGAMLDREQSLPSSTVTGRLLTRRFRSSLENVVAKPQPLRYASTAYLMNVRVSGMFAGIHTGGGRGNAGDLCLYANGMPILTNAPGIFNIPMPNYSKQLITPTLPVEASFRSRDDQETLAVDLTHAYSNDLKLSSCQRTIYTFRKEHAIRMVDEVSFNQPSPAAFSFVTPVKPLILTNAVRLGSVRITWEGSFRVTEKKLDNGVTQLLFDTVESISRGLYTFVFEIGGAND